MLGVNTVKVSGNQVPPGNNTRDIDEWPLLDSRGNTLDNIGPKGKYVATGPRRGSAEKNRLRWREKTPETDDERTIVPVKSKTYDNDLDSDDDLDADEDEEMNLAIKSKIGNAERNYMYPEHEPVKSSPSKPPMLKFKASLFSRNVLVVNRALKKLMDRNEPVKKNSDDEIDDRRQMVRRAENRVKSSKRRQALSLRNQFNELTHQHEELVRENKLLKQIQKRQEKELERYTNADEDLPRLLDANSYEIAGLKSKNKQLLFEKRDLDDKVRRQHQEIISLKSSNKKLQGLINNKKLGEREKLENDLTTARVTIASQESKIQDLTKAVEIYKKTADREAKSHSQQLKKTQNALNELQDNFNDLYVKYKAKEREAGNHYIYAQRARQLDRQGKPVSLSRLLNSSSNLSNLKQENKKPSPDHNDRLLQTLDSELSQQADDLKTLQDDIREVQSGKAVSESTLSDSDIEEDIQPKKEIQDKPSATVYSKPFDVTKRRDDEKLLRRSEELRRAEEMRREAEAMEREEAERVRREEADRIRRMEAEKLRRDEAERLRRIEEENARKKEEAKLLEEKRMKDESMKEKLALLKRNNGGDDFMSQLKANKKIPRSATPNSAMETLSPETTVQTIQKPEIQPRQPVNNYNTHDVDSSVGYQPSFAPTPEPKKPPGNKPAGRKDPLGLDYGGYTPSFSNQRRGSREDKKQTWTPVGRASVTEKNGFFDNPNDKQSILKRRSSQQRNLIKKPTQDELIDDDVEELIL